MPETKVKKSKRIFVFLRIAVVSCGIIGGIFWVSREQRWNRLVQIFRQMNISVFAAVLGIFIISQIMVGFRISMVAVAQNSIYLYQFRDCC